MHRAVKIASRGSLSLTQILALKFSKMEELVKSKDKQIEELVKKIKNKGLT